MKQNPVVRAFFIVAGFLFMALGMVGIVVPILPTTPFLLLTLACFGKGSKRFHHWFMQTGLYQRHLKQFAETRMMTRKGKLCIVIPVTMMLVTTACLIDHIPVRVVIVVLLAVKHYYFWAKIPTIREEKASLEGAAD